MHTTRASRLIRRCLFVQVQFGLIQRPQADARLTQAKLYQDA